MGVVPNIITIPDICLLFAIFEVDVFDLTTVSISSLVFAYLADYLRHHLVAPVIIGGDLTLHDYHDFTTQAYSTSPSASSTAATSSPPSERICPEPLTTFASPASLRDRASGPSERKRARSRRVKNQDHIPRPRNAFIVFRSHYINFLKAGANGDGSSISDNTKESTVYSIEDEDLFLHPQRDARKAQSLTSSEYQQNELSKISANVWNQMSADEKKPYVEEAKHEKEWHKKMYPDYVYRVPSAVSQKMRSFKIKVKTGNPSKNRGHRSDEAAASPASVPHSPGQQKPSDPPPHESSLAAPHTPPNIDIGVVGAPCQWSDSNSASWTGSPETLMGPSTDMFAYDYGTTGFANPLGVDEVLSMSYFFNIPTPSHEVKGSIQSDCSVDSTIMSNDFYPSSTMSSGLLSSTVGIPALAPNPTFMPDFLQLESIMDNFMPLDLEIDVPNLDFELDDGGISRSMDQLKLDALGW